MALSLRAQPAAHAGPQVGGNQAFTMWQDCDGQSACPPTEQIERTPSPLPP